MGLALGLLVVAISTEVAATAALPRTAGFHHPGWTALVIGGYAVSIYLLSMIVRTIPVSVTYAIWAGVGVVVLGAGTHVHEAEVLELDQQVLGDVGGLHQLAPGNAYVGVAGQDRLHAGRRVGQQPCRDARGAAQRGRLEPSLEGVEVLPDDLQGQVVLPLGSDDVAQLLHVLH